MRTVHLGFYFLPVLTGCFDFNLCTGRPCFEHGKKCADSFSAAFPALTNRGIQVPEDKKQSRSPGGNPAAEAPDRVLVFCPLKRETETICAVLRDCSVHSIAAQDPWQLVDELARGLGAAILSAEFFLDHAAPKILAAVLADQPEWSDLPLIALVGPGGSRTAFRPWGGKMGSLNLTVIERPAHSETIAQAVSSALRARKRQYQMRDFIAELITAEERLRRDQKLESIGILAGGMAHNFNNLLTCILGNASIALDSLRPGEKARAFMGQVIDAGERAAYLTRELMAYAGKVLFVFEPLNLTPLIREIDYLIRASVKNVEILFDLSDNLPAIAGDAGMLRQALMNLVINAAEAIPPSERGTVTVRTRIEQIDEASVRSGLNPEDSIGRGWHVCLEVRDSGVGMTPEIQERIFDPFFSTKFTGRGLGLAAVLGIVRGHNGTLKVRSELGKGSTFAIFLPVSQNTIIRREATPRELAGAR
jgi:signal transduction histidine kinase